jgi:predicted nucleic acid-binding protein
MTEESGKALVYFDTNPFMYAFEGDAAVAEPVQSLLRALQTRPHCGVTSELTLAELLAPVWREGTMPLETRRKIYLDLLVGNRFFSLRPITRDILVETASLRSVFRLKLPDAIHLVTASQAGCQFFLSNDGDIKGTPDGLTRIVPDADGIQRVLEAII